MNTIETINAEFASFCPFYATGGPLRQQLVKWIADYTSEAKTREERYNLELRHYIPEVAKLRTENWWKRLLQGRSILLRLDAAQ